MTTASTATRLRSDSDATFREWGLEMSTQLAAVGLVQTADTGQVNWTTVTRPAANTLGGYEIWRFNDALQSTAPIFMRVEYRSGSTNQVPKIRITVGTGSNGSGTITGTALTTSRDIHGDTVATTDTARSSYWCCVAGFFGMHWKVGTTNSEGCFFICRTCDSDGDPTDTGALVYWGNASSTAMQTQALRFAATAAAYTARTSQADAALGISPQSPTSTAVGSDIQVMMGWTITPRVAPLFGVCGVIDAELNQGVTFSATLVGTTARTYIATSTVCPFGPGSSTAQNPKVAFLWE